MLKKLAVLCALIFMLGCNYSKYRYSFFEGNWVLLNYLDTVQKYKSVYKANHLPMHEIYLQRHVDSVFFFTNGEFEKAYPYQTVTSNQISLATYTKPGLKMFINEHAYYLSYTQNNQQLVYVKPNDLMIDSATAFGYPSATQRVINSLVLAGIYEVTPKQKPIQFYLNGNISGLPQFTAYQIVWNNQNYPGDVFSMVTNGVPQLFTWEWQGNTLYIYKLTPINNASNKALIKGQLALKLLKLK